MYFENFCSQYYNKIGIFGELFCSGRTQPCPPFDPSLGAGIFLMCCLLGERVVKWYRSINMKYNIGGSYATYTCTSIGG